ncbi:MAG: HAD family phosphatase, partial [Eudoraea sp.]|nr:HAD family phosphatase [Eudoraea sp.]
MLRNIIFDFGDVFINLDKLVVVKAMAKYDVTQSEVDVIALNNAYETGQISTSRFLDDLTTGFPGLRKEHLQEIWNSMLLDFPEYRLQFLEELKDLGQYRLFLLSNTNALHISHVIYLMGQDRFDRFKNCFEGFYLSHKIGMRKPDLQVFEFVLQ